MGGAASRSAASAAARSRSATRRRHVYDLHVIRDQYESADVAALARHVMAADAELRGKDFPAYAADPVAATLKAIEGIAADAEYRRAYADFCRDMVYGEDVRISTRRSGR